MMSYQLLDSGDGKRLEKFGEYTLIRPCAHAAWAPETPSLWNRADASFSRTPKMEWTEKRTLPTQWETRYENLVFQIRPTNFGHVGLFPEQGENWEWIRKKITAKGSLSLLNLFGYSGAATLVAAKAGATVCHVDAAEGMVEWARENASANALEKASIRWIVDDATKFLKREVRRGRLYDAIVLDPPTFGRGKKGEIFAIERDLLPLLSLCEELLSPEPRFLLLSCHTPGYSALVLEQLLRQVMQKRGGTISSGEMVIPSTPPSPSLPCGFYARWSCG